MLLAFVEGDIGDIALWLGIFGLVVAGVLLALFTAFTVKRKNDENKEKTQSDEKVQSPDDYQNAAEAEQQYLDANDKNNIVLSRNVIYSAGADGQIRAGKYMLKNADNAAEKFNVRVNGLVREYANGDAVMLTDGDTVSPVSGAVVLSACEE